MLLLSLAVVVAQLGTPPGDVGLPGGDGGPPPGIDAGQPLDGGAEPTADLKENEEPSGELEEMRALEEATIAEHHGAAAPDEEALLREALLELGYGQGTRERILDGLDAARRMGGAEFMLAPVEDVEKFDVALVRDRYDIPVEMHPLVAQYIRFFQGPGRKWFRRWMSRSTRFIPMMTPILESQGLPRDLVYLSMIESGFNTSARSWAAAVGPWQFIQATGTRFHLKQDFWVDERRDWVKSTVAAGQYLKELHDDHGHWYLAWAGYNAGGGKVRRLIDVTASHDFWVLSEVKKGFAKETKHYVPKLIACALVARYPQAFGFSPEEFDPLQPLESEDLSLTQQVDLDVLARAGGMDLDALQELNPELKRWCTPPASAEHPYVLRVPKGKSEAMAAAVAKLSSAERLNYAVHRVKKGDTLSAIAAQYHSAAEAIMHLNGLRSARSLKVNSDLVVPVPSAQALKAGREDAALARQVVQARRAGVVPSKPQEEIPAGTQSLKASAAQGTVKVDQVDGKKRVLYGIAPGDSLWSIAAHFDCSIGDLRNWNEQLAGMRKLKVGTALTIWPGPKAELPKG